MTDLQKEEIVEAMAQAPDEWADLFLSQQEYIFSLHDLIQEQQKYAEELHELMEMYKARLEMVLRDPDELDH